MSEHKQSALEWFFAPRKTYEQLQAELSASQVREAELREKLEAAEAKLKEISEAPVVAWCFKDGDSIYGLAATYNGGHDLIFRPIIKE